MISKILNEIISLEENPQLHVARLLILFSQLAEFDYGKEIVGIMKVAKLDFLLRYPTVLEKALQDRRKSGKSISLKDYERTSVESKMIRYRFGPWDHRYWSFLSIMNCSGLLDIGKNEDGTIIFKITSNGQQLAKEFSKIDEFNDYFTRSQIISKNFGSMLGTNLKKSIYKLRPELYDMQYGDFIKA